MVYGIYITCIYIYKYIYGLYIYMNRKFRTGTLCMILNYLAKHLKIPGKYR